MPEDTGTNRNPDGTFKEGVSGNPKGRPKGARSKLSELFCQALLDDFRDNGEAAVEKMRIERPNEYSKMIAGILTQEVEHSGGIELTEIKRTLVSPDNTNG